MSKRRVFSSNIEVNMSDHIQQVARTAMQGGKYQRQPIPNCATPITIIDGATSYLCCDKIITKTECQDSKLTLYPYGKFYPMVSSSKFVFIPADCGC